MYSDIQEIFLAILRSTFNSDECKPRLSDLSSDQWHWLYQLSAEHGLTGVVYASVNDQFANSQISKTDLFSWTLSAEKIANRYQQLVGSIRKLSAIYAENNIRMILLKGVSLSRYYPIPQYREFGDADIFLGDDFQQGNKIACDNGAQMDDSHLTDKHCAFVFDGTMFENHKTLLDLECRAEEILEEYLQGLLACADSEKVGYGAKLAPPMFNLLFVLRHTAVHFAWSVPFRSLCDWATLLYNERSKIDFKELESVLNRSDMLCFYNALTCAAEKISGLPLSKMLIGEVGLEYVDRIIEDCFYTNSRALKPQTNIQKVRRLLYNRWKYSRLLPDSYIKAWIKVIKRHI